MVILPLDFLGGPSSYNATTFQKYLAVGSETPAGLGQVAPWHVTVLWLANSNSVSNSTAHGHFLVLRETKKKSNKYIVYIIKVILCFTTPLTILTILDLLLDEILVLGLNIFMIVRNARQVSFTWMRRLQTLSGELVHPRPNGCGYGLRDGGFERIPRPLTQRRPNEWMRAGSELCVSLANSLEHYFIHGTYDIVNMVQCLYNTVIMFVCTVFFTWRWPGREQSVSRRLKPTNRFCPYVERWMDERFCAFEGLYWRHGNLSFELLQKQLMRLSTEEIFSYSHVNCLKASSSLTNTVDPWYLWFGPCGFTYVQIS